MPVIGHKIAWRLADVSDNMANLGTHHICECECGWGRRGARWDVGRSATNHLERHEYLQFKGNR